MTDVILWLTLSKNVEIKKHCKFCVFPNINKDLITGSLKQITMLVSYMIASKMLNVRELNAIHLQY